MLNRINKRRASGLTIFGSLLALAVFAVLLLGVARWIETRLQEAREERAADQLAILADAARGYALDRFPELLAGAADQEIALATIRAANFLKPGFRDADAMGRGYRVLLRRPSPGILDLVVTQTVAPGDERWPWRAAATAPVGTMRIGTVATDATTRIRGPAVDVDVTAFQAVFTAPAERALAAFFRLDRQTVYGNQLYRTEASGFPEINRMETDLDMDGHDIVDAGEIEARTLVVDTSLEVGGSLTVIGDLLVGETVTVTGAVEIEGDLVATTAEIARGASAASVTATDAARAASLTVSGEVDAGTIGSSGPITVQGDATMARLTATGVSASTVTASTIDATVVAVRQITASGSMTAADAGISQLTVGSCTGC